MALSAACASPTRQPAPDAGAVVGERALPRGKVFLTDAYGGRRQVEVEICATEAARAKGMMGRTELADGAGMLFVFPSELRHTFWMKNTLIPLDMIFIDRTPKVVGIIERAEPQTLISRGVDAPSTYVLEVPGGWSERAGIHIGSKVELHGVAHLPVER